MCSYLTGSQFLQSTVRWTSTAEALVSFHPQKALWRRRDRAAGLFESFEMQAGGLDEELSNERAPEVVFRHVPFYGWELAKLLAGLCRFTVLT